VVLASVLLAAALAGPRLALAKTNTPSKPPADTQETLELEKMLATFRVRNAERYGIKTPNGIDEGRYVKVGGIEQWISIRGENRNNPVILLVHGGPGDVTSPWTYALFGEWERTYTIVQWDQRGGGRTLHRTGDSIASTMTIDRMVEDGIELSELLLKELRKQKLIIVGHSWGSMLGARMAKARPELFYAFVGTGQVANTPRANIVGYEAVLARAKALRNERAIAELTAIGPPPYADYKGWPVLRKWGNRFEGSDRFIGGTLGFALGAPGYTPVDVLDWINGQTVSGRALFEQITAVDPKTFSGEFKVPVFVIQGELDYTTPTQLAREYAANVKAPSKAFVTLTDVGHFALFMRPEAFLAELDRHVRPLLPRP
jgi:pimeloyl-ACP methyl ester carboxylesterase